MRRMALAATACLILAGPALAQSTTESVKDAAKSAGETTGVNSLIGVSPTTQDFVKEVANSDMFELQSSRLAESQGDDKTKTFAKKMIKDHEATSQELKAMLKGGKVKADLPSDLDSTHRSKLDKLKELKGADFDKQYDSDQVTAHKNAVDLFKRYADGGENADLKAWAAKTLPHLQEHLKLAEDLSK